MSGAGGLKATSKMWRSLPGRASLTETRTRKYEFAVNRRGPDSSRNERRPNRDQSLSHFGNSDFPRPN